MKANEAGWRTWWPFALLCLLDASRWILDDAYPASSATLRSGEVACAVSAAFMLLAAVMRGRQRPPLRKIAETMFFGVGVLGFPLLGAALHGAAGDPYNRVASLCFVPVMVFVLSGTSRDSTVYRQTLGPALGGLAGALFLLPLVVPNTALSWVGLTLPPAATAATIVFFGPSVRKISAWWSALALLAGGALFLSVCDRVRSVGLLPAVHFVSILAVVLDLPLMVLTVVAALRLSASRYTSRYFVVPGLAVLEGLILLRPAFTLRTYVGLLLLLGSAATLWRPKDEETEPASLHLR